jgi:hypothetical protein
MPVYARMHESIISCILRGAESKVGWRWSFDDRIIQSDNANVLRNIYQKRGRRLKTCAVQVRMNEKVGSRGPSLRGPDNLKPKLALNDVAIYK